MFRRKTTGLAKEIQRSERELADLRRRHSTLSTQVTDAAAASESAAADLQAYFESGDLEDDKTRGRLEAAALAADGRAAPLKRALEALAARIAETEERLARARDRRERDELFVTANALAAEARDALRGYPEHAKAIVRIFEIVAHANAAVSATNERLPDGIEPIIAPEQAERGLAGDVKEIIRETPLVKWHYGGRHADRGEVEPHDIDKIKSSIGARTGTLEIYREGYGKGISRLCVKRARSAWSSCPIAVSSHQIRYIFRCGCRCLSRAEPTIGFRLVMALCRVHSAAMPTLCSPRSRNLEQPGRKRSVIPAARASPKPASYRSRSEGCTRSRTSTPLPRTGRYEQRRI